MNTKSPSKQGFAGTSFMSKIHHVFMLVCIVSVATLHPLKGQDEGEGKEEDVPQDKKRISALFEFVPSFKTEVSIENEKLVLNLAANGVFEVKDKISGYVWKQASPKQTLKISSPKKIGDRVLEFLIDLKPQLHVRIELLSHEAEFHVLLKVEKPGDSFEKLLYPFPFYCADQGTHLILSNGEGLLISQDPKNPWRTTGEYPSYVGSGLRMPLFGITDLKKAYGVILESEVDSGVTLNLLEDRYLAIPTWYWTPGDPKAGERKIRYGFFSQGSYVEVAKWYRHYYKERFGFKTLDDKRKENADVDKLIGMVNIWSVRDSASFKVVDHAGVVAGLEKFGMEKVMFKAGGDPSYNGQGRLEMARRALDNGWLVGEYTSYNPIFKKSDYEEFDIKTRSPHVRSTGYPEDVMVDSNGELREGFKFAKVKDILASGELRPTDDKIISYSRCPISQIELVKEDLPQRLKLVPFNCYLFDTTGNVKPRVCCSKAHPITTKEEDIQLRKQLLRYGAERTIIGTEGGFSWAVQETHYFEGVGTVNTMGSKFGGDETKLVVGTSKVPASGDHVNIALGERYLIPLFGLVFHDCVVTSWRWNYTPVRYTDPKLWDKHDLFHILFGQAPIFAVSKNNVDQEGPRIRQTYETVCQWNDKIGYAEMLDHRMVTDDKKVQESRFSNGWGVVVNFGDKPFKTGLGKIVNPMGYLTYQWKKD